LKLLLSQESINEQQNYYNHNNNMIKSKNPELKQADIFLTRGNSLLSKAIRYFTRTIGENRTKVNHVGLVVGDGLLNMSIVIEALSRVKKHKLWEQYGPFKKVSVAIYRPINLTADEIKIIIKEAEEQVGKRYGYLKIIAHFLDWILLGAYMFRRLTNSGDYPICSWLVAHAYSKVNKNFGVDPGAANPDDICDFIEQNPSKYQEIYALEPIWSLKK
jgi:hypothetical protein